MRHALARGRGGVDRVAGMVKDWRDTCLVVEDVHKVRCSRRVWWFGPQNLPALRMAGFAEFWPQNSAAPVLERTGGDTWRDRGCQGKATPCEGCGRRIKILGVGPFHPGGVDMLYVNRGSLGSDNNPL
jgi:transposase